MIIFVVGVEFALFDVCCAVSGVASIIGLAEWVSSGEYVSGYEDLFVVKMSARMRRGCVSTWMRLRLQSVSSDY